jgi:hypothetical protein
MCSIPIYFCNIDVKTLEKHTFATCPCTAISLFCLDEWRLIVAELDIGAEVGDDAWSSPVP